MIVSCFWSFLTYCNHLIFFNLKFQSNSFVIVLTDHLDVNILKISSLRPSIHSCYHVCTGVVPLEPHCAYIPVLTIYSNFFVQFGLCRSVIKSCKYFTVHNVIAELLLFQTYFCVLPKDLNWIMILVISEGGVLYCCVAVGSSYWQFGRGTTWLEQKFWYAAATWWWYWDWWEVLGARFWHS